MLPRFAILTVGRSGSTHLVDLLDSHPELVCRDEIFGPESEDPQAYSRSAERRVLPYLDTLGAQIDRPWGLKLTWNCVSVHPAALQTLEVPGIKLVHLLRHDRVAQYFSVQRAQQTGVWHSRTTGEAVTLELDPDHYIAWLHSVLLGDAVLRAASVGLDALTVDYDDLSDARLLARIQSFLGVEPLALTSRWRKLAVGPLHEAVSNWQDFTARVDASPAAWTLARYRDVIAAV